MQISKNFFVICAITSLVSTPILHARESDAQAKAREEMRKKMSELDAQDKGVRAPAPAPPTQATPPPVAAPAPTEPAPIQPAPIQPVAVQPVAAPTPATVDDEATARARAAMREKLRELDTQKTPMRAPAASAPPAQVVAPTPAPQQPVAPVAVPAPAPAPVQAAVPVAAPAAQSMFAPTGQPEDEATARTRAALRQKMSELDAQPGGRPPAYAGAVASQPRPEFKPMTAPPLPISGPKEARLAELLRQYKADQITPNVYHKERAKVLAEP